MNLPILSHSTRVAAAFIALASISPVVVLAQSIPSYAQSNTDEQIRGRVVSFNNGYDLTVRDEKGYIDNVRLHEGTIINPTGVSLEPGMVVSVLGYNAGSYLSANEIDTPYTVYGGVPYYQGRPWSAYGSNFSLGFFFGNTGWWHGTEFHGGYYPAGGARVYNGVQMPHIYGGHGGAFHGRTFAAPPENGGYHFGGGHGGAGHGGGGHGGGHGGNGGGGGHPH